MRYRDFIQNITITFLALLSLFLFSRTQFFQLGAAAGSGTWQRLTAPVSDQISDAPPLRYSLSAPVRAAVTGEYGRYGSISSPRTARASPHQNNCCGSVLSARSRTDSSAAAWSASLSLGKPSVYQTF